MSEFIFELVSIVFMFMFSLIGCIALWHDDWKKGIAYLGLVALNAIRDELRTIRRQGE